MARKKKDLLDPRQTKFLSLYLDPKSTTYSNALQSALKAGYAQEYAENLTGQMPNWLSENVGKDKMLIKAERNLDEFLDLETTVITQSGFTKTNTEILKVKADVTKFVASTVGRARYGGKEDPLVERPHQTLIIINPPQSGTPQISVQSKP